MFLAKQQDDGCWLVNCPLCGWKESVATKIKAETDLTNHMNTTHQQGAQKKVKPRPRVRPAADMPPQLPAAVKERK